jgi:hypothetical protein
MGLWRRTRHVGGCRQTFTPSLLLLAETTWGTVSSCTARAYICQMEMDEPSPEFRLVCFKNKRFRGSPSTWLTGPKVETSLISDIISSGEYTFPLVVPDTSFVWKLWADPHVQICESSKCHVALLCPYHRMMYGQAPQPPKLQPRQIFRAVYFHGLIWKMARIPCHTSRLTRESSPQASFSSAVNPPWLPWGNVSISRLQCTSD